jgi:hypothetical protein
VKLNANAWLTNPDTGERRLYLSGDDAPKWAPAHLIDGATETPPDANAGPEEPPRGGAGATTDAWAAYARTLGIDVPDDASRDDIIALVDAARG